MQGQLKALQTVMSKRVCARLRLPPALAKTIEDNNHSAISVTFGPDGLRITADGAAYDFREAPDNVARCELYEFTDETDEDGFTAERELAATGTHRFLAAVAPSAADREHTKARSARAQQVKKSRVTRQIDKAPAPPKKRHKAPPAKKVSVVRAPSVAEEEEEEAPAGRIFSGALQASATQMRAALEHVQEVGVFGNALDGVYVIFASDAAADAADGSARFGKVRPCALAEVRKYGAPVFSEAFDATRVTRNESGERQHAPSRAEAARAAGFDAGDVKLATLASSIIEHVRPEARGYLGAYEDAEAAHDALERAEHDLEILLGGRDPLSAGIRRYHDLSGTLAKASSAKDADADRLLAQNRARHAETAWESMRCALGLVRRARRAALVGLREMQRAALPETLDGPPADCRLLRGALFFPPSIERLA